MLAVPRDQVGHGVGVKNRRSVPVQNRDLEGLPLSAWGKLIYLVLAAICFLLGIVGVILPGLPTTPFLLLTSYFLIRSSPRLNEKLLQSKWFGPILIDWQVHGGVRADVKVKAVSVVAIAVCATTFFVKARPLLTAVVVASALVGIFVIWRLPAPRAYATLPSAEETPAEKLSD